MASVMPLPNQCRLRGFSDGLLWGFSHHLQCRWERDTNIGWVLLTPPPSSSLYRLHNSGISLPLLPLHPWKKKSHSLLFDARTSSTRKVFFSSCFFCLQIQRERETERESKHDIPPCLPSPPPLLFPEKCSSIPPYPTNNNAPQQIPTDLRKVYTPHPAFWSKI